MMKTNMFRSVTNGILLAALAAIGIAAFQIGTSTTGEENMPEEIRMTEVKKTPVLDTGNSNVTAKMEAKESSGAEEKTVASEAVELTDAKGSEETAREAADFTENVQETAADVYHSPEPIHFSENTAMIWPLTGTLLLDYSMNQTIYFPTLDQYKYNPSISVQAEVGEPVRAAASGKVLSINEDARTGTTVTMELGDSYQAIYGQLKDLNVSEGEMIQAGTVIGSIADPTKYYSKEGANLYFAMKRNGEPIDPILYLP